MNPEHILGELTEQELKDLIEIVKAKQTSFHDLGEVFYAHMIQSAFSSTPTLSERLGALSQLLEAENTMRVHIMDRLQIPSDLNWAILADGRVALIVPDPV